MIEIDNPAKGITGKRVGGEPTNEADHFYVCPKCNQAVDKRDSVRSSITKSQTMSR